MTIDTTSAGMPPIAPAHDALDAPAHDAFSGTTTGKSPQAVQSLIDEGKSQVAATIGGIAEAVRQIASQLEGNGAGPVAKYVHTAADTVSGWRDAVADKSVDDLLDDTKTLVRTSPALAVGLAVAAGFAVSRVVRSSR